MCIPGCKYQEPSRTPEVVSGTKLPCTLNLYAFVVIVGGPGNYSSKDPRHDKAWDNYITTAATRHKDERLKPLDDECLHFFVYREAYERRWNDDVKNGHLDHRLEHVKSIKSRGASSYVDFIEQKARARKCNLVWFDSPEDLFKLLRGLSRQISRVWFFGHAKSDRLFLRWENEGKAVVQITTSDVVDKADLRARFVTNDKDRLHRFYGCNTARDIAGWAGTWSKTFNVYSVGASETIDFKGSGKMTMTTPAGQLRFFSPLGMYSVIPYGPPGDLP